MGLNWTAANFNDAAWTSGPLGIGFENAGDNYEELIQTDLGDQLAGKTSLYLRVPFDVEDPASLDALSLRMKYEDGVVAYVNGTEVFRDGLQQDEPAFDSTSTGRGSSSAVEFQNVNISEYLDQLVPGENILALHVINSSANRQRPLHVA